MIETKKPLTDPVVAVAALLDLAVLTGNRINEFGIVSFSEELHPSIAKEAKELYDRAERLRGMSVVYSGVGFMPVMDHEGDTVTGFSRVEYARGKLHGIYLTDARDLQYVSPNQISVEDEDLKESNVDLLEPEQVALLNFREKLQEPSPGLRLFVEFLIRREVDIDQPIRGHAIRVPEYSVYHIMDAAKLEVVFIDEKPEEPLVECYEVTDALDRVNSHYRKQLRHKNFRNYTAAKQKEMVDLYLQRTNEALGIERFGITTWADAVYIPDFSNDGGFELCMVEKGFAGDCLRIDCIESSILACNEPIRKRKGNFNSATSICIVVEIDDATKDSLGIHTNIVWLPVTNQTDKMHFHEEEIL